VGQSIYFLFPSAPPPQMRVVTFYCMCFPKFSCGT
jgi:hypothetical protein